MDRKETGKTWRDQLLDEAFLDALYKAYETDPDKSYALVEAAHQQAVQALSKIPPQQRYCWRRPRGDTPKTGPTPQDMDFSAAFLPGFGGISTARGWGKATALRSWLSADLFMVPGMERHQLYFENQDRCNGIHDKLSKALGKAQKENLVSIDCAWDERIHHAAYTGFRWGSSLAQEVIWSIAREE